MNKKTIVLAVIVILAAIGGFFWLKQKGQSPKSKVLPDIDRHLTAEQNKIYEDRIKKAEEHLAALDPSKRDYYFERTNTFIYLAQQYYGLGQMQKSKEFYERALSLDPTSLSAISGLSETLIEAGDLEGARAILEISLKNDPGNPDIWSHYIDLRKQQGLNNDELDALYNQALVGTKRHTDILTKYANFEESVGKIAEAIALWEEAIKSYPDRSALYREEIERLKKIK